MNDLRVPLIRNTLVGENILTAKPLANLSILDAGCGGGILSEPLARLGANVTGLDMSETAFEYCNTRLNKIMVDLKPNLTYVKRSIEEFSQDNVSKFDAAVASEVLEHVEDVESFINSVKITLKDNGKFFITTINQTMAAYLVAIIGAEKIVRLVPEGTHQYEKLVPLLSLTTMLERSKFTNCYF